MNHAPTPRRFSTKGFTSLLLTIFFLVMGFSGIILYLTPKGRVAHWTDWTMFGLTKEQWSGLHMNIGFLFLIAAVVHLVLNWTMFWGYLKKRTVAAINLKRELAIAVVIGVLVVVGTLFNVPPFSTVVEFNDGIKRYWAQRAVRAPVPHAEDLSLEQFVGHVNLSVEDAAAALKKEGFTVHDTSITMLELAAQKGIAPSDVFAAIKKHCPEARNTTGPANPQGKAGGRGRGRGRGK